MIEYPPARPESRRCCFPTNHALVLVCIARSPDLRVREIAKLVGITERPTQAILGDLADSGYLRRLRVGRRNAYRLQEDQPLRHRLLASLTVSDLLAALTPHPVQPAATAIGGTAAFL